jgi:hypothetical protein
MIPPALQTIIRNMSNRNNTIDETQQSAADRPAGAVVPNVTFAHRIADELAALATTLGIDPPVSRQSHAALGSDPLHAEELGKKRRLRTQTRRQLVADLSGCPATIQLCAAGSTGTLVRKLLDVRDAMIRPIDVVVGSHKLEGAGKPAAAPAVLTALTIPLYDSGSVIIDNRAAGPVDFEAVPEQVARFVGTLAHPDIDTTDFGQGYWTGWYTSVLAGERRQEELNQAINRAIAGQEPWFSEGNQRFFDRATDGDAGLREDLPDPFHDERVYVAVHPSRYGSIAAREDRTLEKAAAETDAVHLVGLRKLNRRWVELFKRDAVAWLEERIETGRNKYADRWRDLCESNGVTDPVAEFHRFKQAHLADRIETGP